MQHYLPGFLSIFSFVCVTLLLLWMGKHRLNLNLIRSRRIKRIHPKTDTLLEVKVDVYAQTLENISRELQDYVGQQLSLAKLQLTTLNQYCAECCGSKIPTAIDLLTVSIQDLRQLASPNLFLTLSKVGLIELLRSEMRHRYQTGRLITHFEVTGDPGLPNFEQSLILFQIVQDALRSAHDQTTATHFTLFVDGDEFIFNLRMEDNGLQRPDTPDGQRTQAIGKICGRAALMGAVASNMAAPKQGTILTIKLLL